MTQCNHDCHQCGEKCQERIIEKLKMNDKSHIKKVIGIISGKGGVGKSLVTSLLAGQLRQKGHEVGIMDADITGPSIPKALGIKDKAFAEDNLLIPAISKSGIKVISANLLLEHDDEPIIWRGAMISSLVQQFYQDVYWEELDYLLIDMPPGTGDVALTAFQKIPLDGLVIVTTPQELVSMIVKKALKMANMLDIKILGIVENMAYFECDHCHEKTEIYGKSNLDSIAKEYGLPILGRIPIKTTLTKATDKGEIEFVQVDYLQKLLDSIE